MIYGYVLSIVAFGDVFEFNVSFYSDRFQAKRWAASGTAPSRDQCFDEAESYVERVLQDHSESE